MFVTQDVNIAATFNGGGLSGADAMCQNEGPKNLAANWKAVLSTASINAKDRLTIEGPVCLANSGDAGNPTPLVAAKPAWWSIVHQRPIDRTAAGVETTASAVWTGTNGMGSSASMVTCNSWTTTASMSQGLTGNPKGVDVTWIAQVPPRTCDKSHALYCISQP